VPDAESIAQAETRRAVASLPVWPRRGPRFTRWFTNWRLLCPAPKSNCPLNQNVCRSLNVKRSPGNRPRRSSRRFRSRAFGPRRCSFYCRLFSLLRLFDASAATAVRLRLQSNRAAASDLSDSSAISVNRAGRRAPICFRGAAAARSERVENV
jgi:hypothetical protein